MAIAYAKFSFLQKYLRMNKEDMKPFIIEGLQICLFNFNNFCKKLLYEIIHKKVKDEKDRNIETKRGWL